MFYLFYTIYNIIKQENDLFLKLIYMMFVFIITALIYNNFLVQITFTAVSIFVATCCLILYLLPQNSKTKNIIIFVGIVLSFGLRIKACAMILVFFVPALFYKNYKDKENFKNDVIFGLKIAIALLICFTIEKSLYNSPEWKEYLRYNKYRSLYYDYYYDTVKKLPNTLTNEMFQNAGFSEDETKIVKTYGGIAFYNDIPNKMEALIE